MIPVRWVPSLIELAQNALSDEIKEKHIHDTLAKKDPATDKLRAISCKTITVLDYTDNNFVTSYNAGEHVKNMPNLKAILYRNCKNLQRFYYPEYSHLKHLELIDFQGSGGDDFNHVSVDAILPLMRNYEKIDEATTIPKKRVKVLLIDHCGRGVLGRARKERYDIEVKKDAILSGSYSRKDINDLLVGYFREYKEDITLLRLLLAQDNFDCNMNFGTDREPDTMLLWAIGRGSVDLLQLLLARKDLDVNKTFPSQPRTPYDEFVLEARTLMEPDVAEYFDMQLRERGAKASEEINN